MFHILVALLFFVLAIFMVLTAHGFLLSGWTPNAASVARMSEAKSGANCIPAYRCAHAGYDSPLWQVSLLSKIIGEQLLDQRSERPLVIGRGLLGRRFHRRPDTKLDQRAFGFFADCHDNVLTLMPLFDSNASRMT